MPAHGDQRSHTEKIREHGHPARRVLSTTTSSSSTPATSPARDSPNPALRAFHDGFSPLRSRLMSATREAIASLVLAFARCGGSRRHAPRCSSRNQRRTRARSGHRFRVQPVRAAGLRLFRPRRRHDRFHAEVITRAALASRAHPWQSASRRRPSERSPSASSLPPRCQSPARGGWRCRSRNAARRRLTPVDVKQHRAQSPESPALLRRRSSSAYRRLPCLTRKASKSPASAFVI